MKHQYFLIYVILFILPFQSLAQTSSITIKGVIKDEAGAVLEGVNIRLDSISRGTTSNTQGYFELKVSYHNPVILKFSHVRYKDIERTYQVSENEVLDIQISMELDTKVLQQVEISADSDPALREQVSVTRIDPQAARILPSPFGEFNKVLSSLPGVVSNNELSSAYSVRGGNFDENLVYVNDIQIYRPFLVRAGQQEGLSFVNPDLVDNIEFSAGGWQPKYGDKLSSSLNITYKKPEAQAGSATVGLLGGAVHFEGATNNQRVNYIFGARHKSAQYLLNTLETDGEYRPRFTDIQSYINLDLSKEKDSKTELGILFSYARNRYRVFPENRETTFGTFNRVFRLFVAFDGREILQYDTYQGGLKLSHRFNNKFSSDLIVSGMSSSEREYFDIEGGYRLCDVNNNPGSFNFNQCVADRGIGTNYSYGRNKLEADIINIENRNAYKIDLNNRLEFGFGYSRQIIEDELNEYAFIDSADFVTVTDNLRTDISLKSNQYTGYVQNTTYLNERQTLTLGARINYFDLNDQLLISPRLQYSFRPYWKRDVILKAAIGVYQQPPFYRELRDFEGRLNKSLKAQRSVHAIIGLDQNFKLWNRDFKFISEAYYKKLDNVVPYDVDNVRIRYYANNDAEAYAFGMDFRVSGEFIPGTQSWFSLGVLSTKEDLEADDKGYVRRPSDQRINLGIFFQDHLPNDPSVRVNVSVLVGTGLPFGPPRDINQRNIFIGRTYRRVDLGFSKIISFQEKDKQSYLRSLWIGLDVLNLLGVENTISYLWVRDVNNNEFGVPNSLTQRFFNLKVVANF
ncbi:TonB-dependent receptor [Fulvivirgaceae bacterium BMA10]|uniref:TonB-dependent receptor n=1 Tax=Splendidivirga corallicola TaxID=3051826 RepID=A0ABT8KQY8_9BACT|nr:TonB-dependent receptor [Fulvivirgaceae bacterium BMA10]